MIYNYNNMYYSRYWSYNYGTSSSPATYRCYIDLFIENITYDDSSRELKFNYYRKYKPYKQGWENDLDYLIQHNSMPDNYFKIISNTGATELSSYLIDSSTKQSIFKIPTNINEVQLILYEVKFNIKTPVSMIISLNDNGIIKQSKSININDNGVYKDAKELWINNNGILNKSK